jgi:E3 ubiquitin-protein ligase UBR1
LHVHYGVVFPNTGFGNIDDPEVDRLSEVLGLPSFDEMLSSWLMPTADGEYLRSMISAWCAHASPDFESISLSHPAIFELVGLPLHYDTLVDEAMKRKCPKSGKDLSDPNVCLFCGEIICSQAVCCTDKGRGGCNQHVDKCGKDIGVFINIRKGCVLYLHNGHGSYGPAPYLDKYGETDWGLRRNRQLFLNQRRYDALMRNTWLQHGVPSVISRKLEADINSGGWETL